jgi:Ca2+-binding EF-hand superfamily protein
MTVDQAFSSLDSGVGFLTLQDFQARLSRHLDLTLRQPEVAALFLEIDKDGDGIVKVAEFNGFYQEDYERRIAELE